jgi:hypothetical protein
MGGLYVGVDVSRMGSNTQIIPGTQADGANLRTAIGNSFTDNVYFATMGATSGDIRYDARNDNLTGTWRSLSAGYYTWVEGPRPGQQNWYGVPTLWQRIA